MKTKSVFITLAFIIVAAGIALAQEKKVYGYGYAYSYKYKELFVSNIVKAVNNNENFYEATETALTNQWRDKFRTIVEKSYEYQNGFRVYGWYDFETVDECRTKQIGRFTQEGFSIYYIDDFYFRQKRKE